MIRCFKYFLILCLPFLTGAVLHAQRRHDPTFNALDYSMQKRFRAKDDPFINNRFGDNSFIMLGVGLSNTGAAKYNTYSFGGKYRLAFGKWLANDHALRLSFVGDTFRENYYGKNLALAGLDLSYMFRLTSYLDGYSLSRLGEFSFVGGVGARASIGDENIYPIGNIHIGLNASLKIGRAMDLILEPLAYVQFGNLGNYHQAAGTYNFSYGVNLGVNYNFIRKGYRREKIDYKSDVFISLMGGAQFQNSEMMYETAGLSRALGPHAALSFGKKFTDLFSLRSSLFYAHDTWIVYLNEVPYNTYYAGLRLEAMLEFLHFIPKCKDKMAVYILVGPELGAMVKNDVTKKIVTSYFGLGAGIQYKQRIYKNFHLFIEPRVSLVPYTFDSGETNVTMAALDNYYDCLFNLNLGVEFDF